MKRFFFLWFLLTLCLLVGLSASASAVDGEDSSPESESREVSIVFTHGLHSHIQPSPYTGNGGFAKIKGGIDGIQSEYPATFVLDGGDFSQGTSYDAIFAAQAPQLILMGQMGYDAVNLGSCEFGHGPGELAAMLHVAGNAEFPAELSNEWSRVSNPAPPWNGDSDGEAEQIDEADMPAIMENTGVPQVVQSNIDWKASFSDDEENAGVRALYEAMAKYGVSDYSVLEKDGIRVAVLGVTDGSSEKEDSLLMEKLSWRDKTERTQEIVNEIQRNEEADMVVCLLDLNTEDEEKSQWEEEAVDLAKSVSGIDLILGGDGEKPLDKPLSQGETAIISAGQNGESLGHVVLTPRGDGFKIHSYEAIPMESSIHGDENIQEAANSYLAGIDEKLFSHYGYSYGSVLAASDFSFKNPNRSEKNRGEEPLGNLIADSYIYGVKAGEGDKYEKVDVAVVSAKGIRQTLGKGNITASDAFNVLSPGKGPDGRLGFPLVSIYLTGDEIKNMAEADISLSSRKPEMGLYFSGLEYAYNNRRLVLNRVFDVKLKGEDGKTSKPDKNRLYRVVMGLDAYDALEEIEEKSKGFLTFEPKKKDGNPVKDVKEQIIYGDRGEIKEWYALAGYIDAFSDNRLPEVYSEEQGRKVDKTGFNPYTLLKQPNRFGLIVGATLMIPVVIIIGIVLWLRKRRHLRRGYSRSIFKKKPQRYKGKPVFKERRIYKRRGRRSRRNRF